MKKILLSLFGIITIGLVNFGNCENLTMYLDKQLNFSVCSNETNNFCSGTMYFPCNLDFGDFIEISQFYADSSSSFSCNLDLDIFNSVGNYYGLICFPNGCQDINNFSNGNTVITGTFNTGLQTFGTPFAFRDIGVDNSSDGILSCQSSGFYQGNNFFLFGQLEGFINMQCSINNVDTISSLRTDLNSCQNSSSCDYSGYILESEINSGYCLINGLCPSSEICNDSDYSNLFIYSNNKYFSITGTNNIYVNLPSYLGYDYDYSNAGNDLDIDVGMVVDEDYIDGLNAVQNYKPSSEDFTKLVGMLAPYTKYLVFLLFVFIIWAWIKKSFKSKKL